MKKIFRFLPSILWMCVIFYFSTRQTANVGINYYCFRFFVFKSFHLIEYAVLFILLNFAINSEIKSIFIAYLYGVSDEIHQLFTPGRTSKFTDTLIDLLGIFVGVFILKYIITPVFKKLKLSKRK